MFANDNQKIAENLLYKIHRVGYESAYVKHQNRVYFCHFPVEIRAPSSAVVKLLQSVFDLYVDQSFFILRNRIYTTDQVGAMDLGMVKVAGKRITDRVKAVDHGLPIQFDLIEVAAADEIVCKMRSLKEENYVQMQNIFSNFKGSPTQLVLELARQVSRGEVLHDFNRNIAAVLFDGDNTPLNYGVNQNSLNKTLHAEVNLVQSFYLRTGRKLPIGAKIFCTHKPCKMCAGMIHDWSEDIGSLQVIYQQDVTGRLSRRTVLD
jgi:deoxycytidylate deaminase